MRNIIAGIKVFCFPLITVLAYLVYFAGYLWIHLFGIRYENWRNKCMRYWGSATIRLFNMKLIIDGKAPDPPFLLVSNHLSYIDIPVYSSLLATTFVSKSEVREWPMIGFMAKTLGIIFINRRKKSDVKRVNQKISDELNELQGIVLFPEGTTSPGMEIMRFRPSLLDNAAANGMQVSYSSIRYQTSENDIHAYKSVCWWGNVNMLKHLFLMGKNRRIDVFIHFGPEKIVHSDRKVLAETLQRKVSDIFEPVVGQIEEKFEPLKL